MTQQSLFAATATLTSPLLPTVPSHALEVRSLLPSPSTLWIRDGLLVAGPTGTVPLGQVSGAVRNGSFVLP